MPINTRRSDPIAAAKRRSEAVRRIGVGKTCTCGESRPAALIAGSNPITCTECKRNKENQSPFDAHHVAGKSNHALTIPVPANDHRSILNEQQYSWPKATRENALGSPLLAAAASIRGLFDTIVYLLHKLLLWIPELLEMLDAFLAMHFESMWWCNEEYVGFMKEDR
jgi:hypothetical protein